MHKTIHDKFVWIYLLKDIDTKNLSVTVSLRFLRYGHQFSKNHSYIYQIYSSWYYPFLGELEFWYLEFSYFEFKIRLIKLGISFQKQKFLYMNSQPTDFQSGVITITLKSQLLVGDTEKLSVAFSHVWLILVGFT